MSTKLPLNLGDRVGKWTILQEITGLTADTRFRRYLCLCECGKEKEVDASSLRKGVSKSCGCNRKIGPISSALKINHLTQDTRRQFGLIAQGSLPPADAFSVAEGEPCWNLRSIAEILDISRDQLLTMLAQRSKTPRLSTEVLGDFHMSD